MITQEVFGFEFEEETAEKIRHNDEAMAILSMLSRRGANNL